MHFLSLLIARIGVGVSCIYGVVKFFDLIGSRLSEDTNLAVAVWILDLGTAKSMRRWPSSCLDLFQTVYGPRHFTWKCFRRSAMISAVTATVSIAAAIVGGQSLAKWAELNPGNLSFIDVIELIWPAMIYLMVQWCICDYLVLGCTRLFVRAMARTESVFRWIMLTCLSAAAAICLSLLTALAIGAGFYYLLGDSDLFLYITGPVGLAFSYGLSGISVPLTLALLASLLVPVVFTSFWLTLYAVSGGLLKVAVRVDRVAEFLKRHLDIERRPVQCIGLVAGFVVGILYVL